MTDGYRDNEIVTCVLLLGMGNGGTCPLPNCWALFADEHATQRTQIDYQ